MFSRLELTDISSPLGAVQRALMSVSCLSVCLSVCCVTFAESEPYCHSILFVRLSVIPRPTAYHD